MDSIEPFDYAELKPFSTAYLPGFLADKYDVSVEDSQERADRRCRETLENSLRDTVHGYTSCVPITKNIHLKRGKVHYALLPVWMLQHEMGRQRLPVCHERADGPAGGRSSHQLGKMFWNGSSDHCCGDGGSHNAVHACIEGVGI